MKMDESGKQASNNPNNIFAYLDIKIGKQKAGRVIIELYNSLVPKTVANFLTLCKGDRKSSSGKKLHYKGSIFHKVIPQFMAQSGELLHNGILDECIYGKSFEDENFSLLVICTYFFTQLNSKLHGAAGAVGMANNGPNSNVSQFYITTVPCSHLDGINVVFGYVRKGLSIIREITETPRIDDRPVIPCLIDDCGEIKPGEDFKINESDGTLDIYPPWPEDFDDFPVDDLEKVVTDIKISGNYYFNKKNYDDSDRKYKKVLRYIDWINHCNYKHNCATIKKLKLQTLLNLAAVKLKTGGYSDVIKICSQVLEMDKKQSKAFYRRGQARLKLEDYDKAIIDFDQARKLVPNDSKIQQDYFLAKKLKQSYLQKERITCSRMFQ